MKLLCQHFKIITRIITAYIVSSDTLNREGVDIFLVESITDVRNAEIAAELCREIAPEKPIIFSATLSKITGLLASGRPVEKFVEDVAKYEPEVRLLFRFPCFLLQFCHDDKM